MQLTTVIALAPLLGMALAAPKQAHEKFHHRAKRDIAWVTVTDEVIETVYETTTIYVAPGEVPSATPTPIIDSSSGLGALQGQSSTSTSTTSIAAASPSPAPPAPSPPAPPAQSAPAVQPSSAPPVQPSPAPVPAPSPTPSSPSPPSTGGAAPAVVGSTLPGADQAIPACTDGCQGQATFYDVGLGACGETSSPSDMIVAVPVQLMGSLSSSPSNMNPLCGQQVKVNLIDGVEPVTATIVDKCGGCVTPMDLDMSTGLFEALGGQQGAGRYTNMTWWWA